jgi:hypothetical protein
MSPEPFILVLELQRLGETWFWDLGLQCSAQSCLKLHSRMMAQGPWPRLQEPSQPVKCLVLARYDTGAPLKPHVGELHVCEVAPCKPLPQQRLRISETINNNIPVATVELNLKFCHHAMA